MTDAIDAARRPKTAAPPLTARAARPLAVRLRGTPVKIAVTVAALVLAFAFVWSFILGPSRAHATGAEKSPSPDKAPTAVRPAEAITSQPADYSRSSAQWPTAALLPGAAQGGAPTTPSLPTPRIGTDALAAVGPVQPAASEQSAAPVSAPPETVHTPSPTQEALSAARGSGLFFAAADSQGGRLGTRVEASRSAGAANELASASPQAQADYDAVYGRHALLAPVSPFEVKAGTLIPAALLTVVDTGRPGPVVAVTTAPVFDTVSGRTLLIPQGTRLIGVQAGDSAYGERRAFLVWKRLILPNGKSLILDDQAATDAAGATGVPGRAEHRWLPLGGALLASGAISTLGELARSHNDSAHASIIGDVGDATAIQAVQVGGRLLDRELNVQPKVIVRAGAPVQVLLTKDLILEPAQ